MQAIEKVPYGTFSIVIFKEDKNNVVTNGLDIKEGNYDDKKA